MFLLDDLLLTPGKAALFLFQELARKANEDWLNDDAVKQELQELYTLLDAGKMSGPDFEARESRLLQRLEQIARARSSQAPALPASPLESSVVCDVTPIESVAQPVVVAAPPPPSPSPPRLVFEPPPPPAPVTAAMLDRQPVPV